MKVSYIVYEEVFGHGWVVEYHVDGYIDYDVRGTYGLGIKIFDTKEKAEASGKRYVKKMVEEYGFER